MSNLKDKIKAINSLESIINTPVHIIKDILKQLADNGVKKVEDISQLDKNAENGSLAVVAKKEEIISKTTRELKEIPYEQIDLNTFSFDTTGLDRVNSIDILPIITDISLLEGLVENAIMLYCPIESSIDEVALLYSILYRNPNVVVAINMANDEDMYVLFIIEDGKIKITEDGYEGLPGLKTFNEILKNNKFYFIGAYIPTLSNQPIPEGVHIAYSNILFKQVTPPDAILYIKNDDWKPYQDPDIITNKHTINNIQNTLNNKQNATSIITSHSLDYAKCDNNTYVKTPSSLLYFDDDIKDSSKYSKYIIEITCDTNKTLTCQLWSDKSEVSIKWENDTPPTLEEGYIYIITIECGLGYFDKYSI